MKDCFQTPGMNFCHSDLIYVLAPLLIRRIERLHPFTTNFVHIIMLIKISIVLQNLPLEFRRPTHYKPPATTLHTAVGRQDMAEKQTHPIYLLHKVCIIS